MSSTFKLLYIFCLFCVVVQLFESKQQQIMLLFTLIVVIVITTVKGNSREAEFWPIDHVNTVKQSGDTVVFELKSGDHREVDAGVYELAMVGGVVWEDLNADGILTPDENDRIRNVPVYLHRTSDESVVGRTQSDDHGQYGFYDLDVGEYYVKFDIPPNFFASPQHRNVAFQRRHSVPNESGRTPTFSLDSGVERVDIDLGLYRSVSTIGCLIFNDANGDGVRTIDEKPQAGVLVQLRDAKGNVVATKTTDSDGDCNMLNLRPGDYTLHVELPNDNYSYSIQRLPLKPDSSCVDSFGNSPLISLRPSTPSLCSSGIYRYSEITAELFDDRLGDGLRSDAEGGKADVTALLLRGGYEIDRQQTDTSGKASFSRRPPGEYFVEFAPRDCSRCRFTRQHLTRRSIEINDSIPIAFDGTSMPDAEFGVKQRFFLYSGEQL